MLIHTLMAITGLMVHMLMAITGLTLMEQLEIITLTKEIQTHTQGKRVQINIKIIELANITTVIN